MKENLLDLLNQIDSSKLTTGKLLRSFRKALNLTLKEVEELSNIKEQNLSALENDRMEMSIYYSEILAAVLGIHPTDLLFPNGKWVKSEQIKAVEKKSKTYLSNKKAV